ncbi:MAG: HAMP domain-containing sensor histidine kinase [Actinomycetota bacterium]
MQRRLMVAMVGIALAAVVFVGAGVLTLSQFDARSTTEAEVRDGLQALTRSTQESDTFRNLRTLQEFQVALGLKDLEVVLVDEKGVVSEVENVDALLFDSRRQRPGPGRGNVTLDDDPVAQLNSGELAAFESGVILYPDEQPRGSRRTVVFGLQRLPPTFDLDFDGIGTQTPGLMATKNVETVSGQARSWFVLSALLVLTLAVIAAWWLARRFTRPIKAIEQATSDIAAGDFDVEVETAGDDELAQLGRSVNRMASDLQRSKALDQQFLMSVSHDLRTPLTAISGYAEALRDGAARDPVHVGEVIGNQANRLERLVGDLLDLARLDANRFALHPRAVDVTVIAGRNAAGLQPKAQQAGIDLAVRADGPVEAWADPDRLAQCIGNLTDNAIKFARSAVRVTVADVGGGAVVTVADDGPGIDPVDLPHIFDRLYTGADQPERAENATGLGLAIVRELVTAMGGSVAAASELGRGTTMTLELAAGPPAGWEAVAGARPDGYVR